MKNLDCAIIIAGIAIGLGVAQEGITKIFLAAIMAVLLYQRMYSV